MTSAMQVTVAALKVPKKLLRMTGKVEASSEVKSALNGIQAVPIPERKIESHSVEIALTTTVG